METNHTVESLKAFEKKIATHYEQGRIKAPVHLRGSESGNYEQFLIDLFKDIKSDDYLFGYWAFHLHSLLKGVPEDELEQSILNGDSIALSFPEQRILCSGIVGSLMGVATGAAWSIKQRKGNQHVWCFVGDMGAETGIFHESIKYAAFNNLPVTFVREDNELSVMTDTKKAWGRYNLGYNYSDYWWSYPYRDKIKVVNYKNEWPHSGIAKRVNF